MRDTRPGGKEDFPPLNIHVCQVSLARTSAVSQVCRLKPSFLMWDEKKETDVIMLIGPVIPVLLLFQSVGRPQKLAGASGRVNGPWPFINLQITR